MQLPTVISDIQLVRNECGVKERLWKNEKKRKEKKRKTTYHTVTPVTNPNDSSKMVRPPCRLHDKLTSRLNKHWWKRETIQTSDWGQRISHQTTRGTNCADEQKRAVKLKETKSYWWPRHADREIDLIGGDGMNCMNMLSCNNAAICMSQTSYLKLMLKRRSIF